MIRRRRWSNSTPPPTPPGMVWEVDGSELVTAEDFAAESVREMAAYDRLPRSYQLEIRRTGESAVACEQYLKGKRQ